MDVRINKTYSLVLTPEEFRLVSKALRGQKLNAIEAASARALQEQMQRARHDVLTQELRESQKAVDNIDASAESP